MRLAVRIPLLGVGAVLVTGLAAAMIAVVLGQNAVRVAAFAATEAGAEAYGATVQFYLKHAAQELESFSELDPVARTWSHEGLAEPESQGAIRTALSRSMAKIDRFEYVALVHLDGRVFLVEPATLQGELVRPDVAYLPWFSRLATKGAVVSDLFVSTVTHRSSVIVGTAVRDAGGRTVGYLVGGLRLSEVSALGGTPTAGYFGYLTDSRGLVVAHGRDPRLAAYQTDFSSVLPVRAALSGGEGVVEHHNAIEDEDRVAAYRPLPGLGWSVVYVVPTRLAFAPVGPLITAVSLTTVGLLTLVGFIAAVIARRATRPIGRLALAAEAIAAGNTTVRLPPAGTDEVGLLTREIEHMVRTLGERGDELQRRATELRAANEELESFAYSVAHDLKTPLRAISGFGSRLAKRLVEADPETTRDLGIIRANAQRMADLIDDLLEFARLGRQAPSFSIVDPAAIARDVLDELGTELSSREIEIVVGELPPCRADPHLLGRVYANLLSNAVKFTRAAGRPARIEVGCRADAQPVEYFVRDNGVGLDMAYAEEIFGVFKRLVREDEYEGTGVGLAIVRRIVGLHHGRIWVESSPGAGAAFFFTLTGGSP